jgi:hypothetical protein
MRALPQPEILHAGLQEHAERTRIGVPMSGRAERRDVRGAGAECSEATCRAGAQRGGGATMSGRAERRDVRGAGAECSEATCRAGAQRGRGATINGRAQRILVIVAVLGAMSGVARAQDLKDRFNIRLSLTGMYMTEQDLGQRPMGIGPEATVASPLSLAYGDLRVTIDARRLPGKFDIHLDGRVRATGEYSRDAADEGKSQITARGYEGGREYELRSAWFRRRGDKWDFAFGRMIVAEADALRIDGARLWWRMAKHWDASLYGGAFPDPYSRSVLSDYTGGFAYAGGADATYTYDRIWGSLSVNGSYLGGKDDGGPLSAAELAGMVTPPTPRIETPRVWITWTDYVRFLSWLDLFTDLVFDAAGAAGAQLTRLDALLAIRAGSHVNIRLGYDHLSAYAIEMFMNRFRNDRTVHLANTIENNLVVQRTARDEARGQVDVSFGKFGFYGEGRFRRRAIVSLNDDPQLVNNGSQVAPGIAYDATIGLRDRGSLAGLRFNLWASYISDYRARNIIASFEMGRSWFDERLSLDLVFLYAKTDDAAAGLGMGGAPVACDQSSPIKFSSTCYGTRRGSSYEGGLTLAGEPFSHWYGFLDYRVVADQTDGIWGTVSMTPVPQPTVLTHVLLFRIEARY